MMLEVPQNSTTSRSVPLPEKTKKSMKTSLPEEHQSSIRSAKNLVSEKVEESHSKKQNMLDDV